MYSFPICSLLLLCYGFLTVEKQYGIEGGRQDNKPNAFKRWQNEERITQLAAFFPLLSYRKVIDEQPIIIQLRERYAELSTQSTFDPAATDKEYLIDLIVHCMNKITQDAITFVDCQKCNKKHAHALADAVIKAFHEQSMVDIDGWLSDYKNQLHHHLKEQLHLINGKVWMPKSKPIMEEIYHSLSYVLNNKKVKEMSLFINELAGAHAFFQAIGFSTQNEHSCLILLDLYHCAHHHKKLSEVRTIISYVLQPLLPLYYEYKNIALYEKNFYRRNTRIIIPLCVAGVSFILISMAMATLVLPEFAGAVLSIIILFLSVACANGYVSVKNRLYNNIREFYYGGTFEIPEFQVNARMLHAFAGDDNASKIRTFYIEALQQCDDIEIQFNKKNHLGILSQADIDDRKENASLRKTLLLEWYDIHSNLDLAYNKAPLIVLHRLQQHSDIAYRRLRQTIAAEHNVLQQAIDEVSLDLKSVLITHTQASTTEPKHEKENTVLKAYGRQGFFKMRSLYYKTQVELMTHMQDQMTHIAQCS